MTVLRLLTPSTAIVDFVTIQIPVIAISVADYPQAQTHRRLAMITDRKVSLTWVMLNDGHSMARVARKLKMGEKTVKKYRDTGSHVVTVDQGDF